MALVLRTPRTSMLDFFGFPYRRRYGSPFGGMSLLWPEAEKNARAWNPRIDVAEHDDSYILTVELPGAEPGDVEVTAGDGILTIKGRKHDDRKIEREGYHWHEYSESSFSRSIPLPETAEVKKAEATLEGGVLEVTVPRTEPIEPATKRIDIHSAGYEDEKTEAGVAAGTRAEE